MDSLPISRGAQYIRIGSRFHFQERLINIRLERQQFGMRVFSSPGDFA
jgi:hypothetical protein